jgi:hypothetical protein
MRDLQRPTMASWAALGLALAPGIPPAYSAPVPLPRVGGCPLGYYAASGYCIPSRAVKTGDAVQKSGGTCPFGYYSSGNYCVTNPSNGREAIQKTGSSCPLGWFSSGAYCVKNR